LTTIRLMTLATIHPLEQTVSLRHAGLDHEAKLHSALRLITEALLDNYEEKQSTETHHEEQYDTVVQRYAGAVQDNERLRRKNRDLEETVRAKGRDLEGKNRQIFELQGRISVLEEALRNPVPDSNGFRQLDRLVREVPTRR
jgi:hypothetical protein